MIERTVAADPAPTLPIREKAWRGRCRKLPLSGRVGAAIVLLWGLVALFGGALSPHDAGDVVSNDVFARMSLHLPLGSDFLGRDMLSRVLVGARYTVGLALAAALAASTTGTLLALAAV